MSEKMNEVIHDIAVKHGVLLSKDDPVLILHTMNEKLLAENRQAQQEMLAQFKVEMENISSEWTDDAKEKAEKILNAALASSKETMSNLLRETTNEAVLALQKLASDILNESNTLSQNKKKLKRFALLSSASMLAAFCICLLLSIKNSLL